jgi:ubiquitin-conjugating enzyme E2 M
MFQLGQTSKNSRIARETGKVKKNSGQLRISKDVNELDAPDSVEVRFPDPDDLMTIALTLAPEEGYYAAGSFEFTITIPPDYPHSPPKVHSDTLVYHPNIDLDGNVCLNILRQDWKPVLTLSAVLYGLVLLFLSPNPDDPLNKEAADLLKRDKAAFRRNVDQSLRGGYVNGTMFKDSRR